MFKNCDIRRLGDLRKEFQTETTDMQITFSLSFLAVNTIKPGVSVEHSHQLCKRLLPRSLKVWRLHRPQFM